GPDIAGRWRAALQHARCESFRSATRRCELLRRVQVYGACRSCGQWAALWAELPGRDQQPARADPRPQETFSLMCRAYGHGFEIFWETQCRLKVVWTVCSA